MLILTVYSFMRLLSSIFIFIILHLAYFGATQDRPVKSIDFKRLKLHEDIDQLQQVISKHFNSLKSTSLWNSKDVNWFETGVDSMQTVIELDTVLTHRLKVKYLTGLIILMQEYHKGISQNPLLYEDGFDFFKGYINVVDADRIGASLIGLAMGNPYEINSAIFGKATVFFDHPEIYKINIYVYRQFADLFPEKVLSTLVPYLIYPLADTLIIRSAKQFPSQFYDYASASRSQLGKKISLVKDSTVQLLYKIAQEKSGRLIFPFFPLLLNNELKYEKLKANISNEARYFSMLVNTRMVLEKRQFVNDEIFINELDRVIGRKSEEVFIKQINARHEYNDSARFSIVAPLSSDDIYYMIVSGENALYTSSYLGLFDRMINKATGQRGDSILLRVGYHHFRKFLKMAAAFNKLDGFLSTMPDSTAILLIKKFVSGLEKAEDIADAVEVADAYSSIIDSTLKLQVRNEVSSRVQESKDVGDIKGERIYSLLNVLFDSSNNLHDLMDSIYNLSNIFTVAYTDVADISGKVVEQVFFYGDKDSKESYENFMAGFRDKVAWKITEREYWVEIRSIIGKSIWIFANLPLSTPIESEKYVKAQHALIAHLDSMKISPAVVVHRGHSYFLNQSINQFPSNAKIVLVGSCGGYQLLNAMLDRCPNAHIISTKEVGTKAINDPILKLINESLRMGLDINWIEFWKNLEIQFSSRVEKLRFENYIPPYKNLGAIFIKAYSSITAKKPALN